MASSLVVDASAILAVLNDEAGANLVRLAARDGVDITSANYAEVLTRGVDWGVDFDLLRASTHELVANVIDFDADLAERAARLRPVTRGAGLSLADRACLALAQRNRVPALTADRNWVRLDLDIEIQLIR